MTTTPNYRLGTKCADCNNYEYLDIASLRLSGRCVINKYIMTGKASLFYRCDQWEPRKNDNDTN